MEQPIVTSFPHNAKTITPSDTVDLTDHGGAGQAQMVQSIDGGDVEVIPNGGPDSNVIVFTVAEGGYVPCVVKRVLNSNTTSSNLMGYW